MTKTSSKKETRDGEGVIQVSRGRVDKGLWGAPINVKHPGLTHYEHTIACLVAQWRMQIYIYVYI